MRSALLLMLLVLGGGFAAFPAVAAGEESREDRLRFLVRLFDLNETAFAYHRHCISKERMPDAMFVTNLDYVANALLQEMTQRFPAQKPANIKADIMGRRYAIQQQLNGYYYNNGCDTDQSLVAESHYQQFRSVDAVAVQKLIMERTGGG